jgi:fatty acid desaturase
MSLGLSNTSQKSLKDAELKEQLQELRQTDNFTNWYYLVRTYLILLVVLGGAVWFDLYRQDQGWSVLWSVPVFLLAILIVGTCQHQLSGLAHEGSHHILFRNRTLNELISDWFCLFPLFSSTHHYRLQHLAHHQFVNDPERDPDVSQLQTSGHWLKFPLSKRAFLGKLLEQMWVPNLIRFILVRGRYNATGTDKNPYRRKGEKQSKTAVRIGILYLFSLIGSLAALVYLGDDLLLAVLPAVLYGLALIVYAVLPGRCFHQSRLHPVISQRWMTMLRITFITAVFVGLAWITHVASVPAYLYYFLLWLVPLFTSFSFFMILRQIVQHGNGDRGWLSNTRTFFVGRLINFAVFPIGQDYHLPHHLYATVPHYRLQRLHEILLEYPEYREQALEVHGYFFTPERPQIHPTVLDVLGPEYAPREFHGVHIDNTVLDDCVVEEKEQILAEGEQEAQRVAQGRSAEPRRT